MFLCVSKTKYILSFLFDHFWVHYYYYYYQTETQEKFWFNFSCISGMSFSGHERELFARTSFSSVSVRPPSCPLWKRSLDFISSVQHVLLISLWMLLILALIQRTWLSACRPWRSSIQIFRVLQEAIRWWKYVPVKQNFGPTWFLWNSMSVQSWSKFLVFTTVRFYA